MHQNRKEAVACIDSKYYIYKVNFKIDKLVQNLELKSIPLYTQQRYICLCIQIYWYEGKYASIQCTYVNNVSENRKQYNTENEDGEQHGPHKIKPDVNPGNGEE